MKQFDIKNGWFKKIEGEQLPKIMETIFGNVTAEGDKFVSTYGIMERVEVKIISRTVMEIDTINKSGTFSDDDIIDSKRALNKFMEEATGFNAKTRVKREQKKAKEGKL